MGKFHVPFLFLIVGAPAFGQGEGAWNKKPQWFKWYRKGACVSVGVCMHACTCGDWSAHLYACVWELLLPPQQQCELLYFWCCHPQLKQRQQRKLQEMQLLWGMWRAAGATVDIILLLSQDCFTVPQCCTSGQDIQDLQNGIVVSNGFPEPAGKYSHSPWCTSWSWEQQNSESSLAQWLAGWGPWQVPPLLSHPRLWNSD